MNKEIQLPGGGVLPLGEISIGFPVVYRIKIDDSKVDGSNIFVNDALPPGFMFAVPAAPVACTGSTTTGGLPATCPPALGLLNLTHMGPFTIPIGGEIVLLIPGFFQTSGPKVNTVTASPSTGNSNSSSTPNIVPNAAIPVDIRVDKVVNPTTAVLSTSTATLHYSITVTNTSAQDLFLGGVLRLTDVLTNSSGSTVNFTAKNPKCDPAKIVNGADCMDLSSVLPTLPSTLQTNTSRTLFVQPYAPTGHMPPNSSFTVEFDVEISAPAACDAGPTANIQNQAFIELFNGTSAIGDINASNNTSTAAMTAITFPAGTTTCDGGSGGAPVKYTKDTVPPVTSGFMFSWGSTVTYQITVMNPGVTTMTNVPVRDVLFKNSGTPPFVATMVTAPACVSGCTLTNINQAPPFSVVLDNQAYSLWDAVIPSLGTQVAIIEYSVKYDAVCETDSRPDVIGNIAENTSGTIQSSPVYITMKELATCNLKVEKTQTPAGPIVFEQQFQYVVVFSNPSTQQFSVGTVRDQLSVDSNQYGVVPFDYNFSCTATGNVNPVPTSPGFPALIPATVNFVGQPWRGVAPIDQPITFDAGASLKCTFLVKVHRPTDDSPFCQGAGTPQLVNFAFMDLTPQYNSNSDIQPLISASVAAQLPLCRKVIVKKIANNNSPAPGATVIYTVTVENLGKDPVSNFALHDQVLTAFTGVSASVCTPPLCLTGPTPTGNTIDATFAPLPPGQIVSFQITVTAPKIDGAYPNLAVGSFPPSDSFYFQGPAAFLIGDEQITVITPPGFIEICKASDTTNPVTGMFTFTSPAFTGGPIMVPVGTCSGPIQVTPGPVKITETATPGVGVSSITASGLNPATQATENRLVASDLPNRTATVTAVSGDASTVTIVTYTNFKVPTGYIEVCKLAAQGATVTGSFTFNIPGAPNNPYTIPVGACSGPIPVQAGSVTVTETPRAGYKLVDVTTIPSDRLVSKNLPGGSAIATAVGGDLSTETVIIFTNDTGDGQMKICKIAGAGITPGQTFTISSNGVPYSVPAGPPEEGGFCVLDSTFPVGTVVNVQETIPSGDQVSSITVNPPDRGTGKPDLVKGATQVTVGTGFTEVTYTNIVATPPPSGQLTICKIAGQGVDIGTNFTFTATGQGSTQTYTVPAGPASQGGFCVKDGTYPVGTLVTIMEVAPARTVATSITVAPADRGSKLDLINGSVAVTIGTGSTDVTFTNSASAGIATTLLLAGQPGVAFSQTLAATGGTPPYFWQLTDGMLPPGFVLNPFTGEISGPPMDNPAPISVTFKVIDSSWPAQTQSASFTQKSTGCCTSMRPSWAARP